MKISPKLKHKLESDFGYDCLNPIADLGFVGGTILHRIHALRQETDNLEQTYANIIKGMDRLIAERQ